MQLNTDYSRRVVMRPDDAPWSASPEPGVDRRRLERDGDEIARATSIVRYAPGSRFAAHVHGGGEEILVLEGVFEDEFGAYPAGTYLRSPIGSRHTPFSTVGTVLLVKLWQFEADDRTVLRMNTHAAEMMRTAMPGIREQVLHTHGEEQVRLLRFEPGAHVPAVTCRGGEEIYVIEGEFHDAHGRYAAGTWLRHPPGDVPAKDSGPGALLYVKTGHLPPRTARPHRA